MPEPKNADPAATQAQLVKQSTPDISVRAEPAGPAGGLLTWVQAWPFQVRTWLAALVPPTAVQLVGLKQLRPERPLLPLGVGTFWFWDQLEPLQVMTTLVPTAPPAAPQKVRPAHDTEAGNQRPVLEIELCDVQVDPFQVYAKACESFC